jgi:hypothetical protein
MQKSEITLVIGNGVLRSFGTGTLSRGVVNNLELTFIDKDKNPIDFTEIARWEAVVTQDYLRETLPLLATDESEIIDTNIISLIVPEDSAELSDVIDGRKSIQAFVTIFGRNAVDDIVKAYTFPVILLNMGISYADIAENSLSKLFYTKDQIDKINKKIYSDMENIGVKEDDVLSIVGIDKINGEGHLFLNQLGKWVFVATSDVNWLGDYASAPAGSNGDGYHNTTNGNSYIYYSGGWRILAKAGKDGNPGLPGTNGTTPHIDNDTGNWFIGEVNTGVRAEGLNGVTPHVGENGNWWIGNTDTEVQAEGIDGEDGKTPYIGENKNWWINGIDTGVYAEAVDGITPHINENTNTWFIGDVDTGVQVTGNDGFTPTIGNNGNWFIDGVDTGKKAIGEDAVTPHIDGASNHWFIGDLDTSVNATGDNGLTPHIDSVSKNWMLGETDTEVRAEGEDGISIIWQGDLSEAPSNPELNWAYRNTTDKKSYIYDGASWEVMTEDGKDGADGESYTIDTDLVTKTGTSVTVKPFEQLRWTVTGTCELGFSDWALSGFETALMVITFSSGNTFSVDGAEVIGDIPDDNEAYTCIITNQDGELFFTVKARA